MLGESDVFQFNVDSDRRSHLPHSFIGRPLEQYPSLW